MSTAKAISPASKKSQSSSDYSSGKNANPSSVKTSESFSSPVVNGMQSANASVGAFYASAPVASVSPAIQAKLIQKKENISEGAGNTEVDGENNAVQFACAECDRKGQNGPAGAESVAPDEKSGAVVVQQERAGESSSDGLASGAGDAVQMWSCGGNKKPTCSIQKKDIDSPVQFMCAECKKELEGDDKPVQLMCAECEKELEGDDKPVQLMCAECKKELEGDDNPVQENGSDKAELESDGNVSGLDDAVQMWSCGGYKKPTCSIQKMEDGAESEASTGKVAEESDAVIQERSSGGEGSQQNTGKNNSGDSTLSDASSGLKNAHGALPHYDSIQSSFGHHDVSNIRTEVGGSAGRASKKMGALAYASGDRIGFRNAPGLHLAAHEAAHTVQQRSGLKLPGNVGTPGDKWERHADSVADAVVAGRSAESLLDDVAPVPSSSSSAATVSAPGDSVAVGRAVPANGDGISGAAVQHRFTSGASHQVASLESDEVDEGGGAGSAGTAKDGEDAGGEAAEAAASESTEAVAEQAPSDPAADCAKSKGEENSADPAKDASADGGSQGEGAKAEAGGKPEKGRCYDPGSSDPPEGTEKPKSDAPPNKVEEKSKVTYGDWVESDDTCECAALEAVKKGAPGAGESQGAEKGQTESVLSTQVEGGAEGLDVAAAASSGGSDAEVSSSDEIVESSSEGSAEAAGGEGAGAKGGGDSTTDFGQNESSRDAAAAGFDAAIAKTRRVPDRAAKLSKGLDFSAPKTGGAAEEAARANSLDQIRSFMVSASSQIDGAVSFVSDEVPARFGSIAESVKAGISASMSSEKDSISARINRAKAKARGKASDARGAINASHIANVSRTVKETDAAIATLGKSYETSSAAVSKRESAALAEINNRFSKGRTDHEGAGTKSAGLAISTGQAWVDAYDGCRSASGNKNKYNGDDGFWDGCLTVRRAKAQQDAACKTASGTASSMIEMSKKKGFELRKDRTQYRCAVISGAGEAQKALDTAFEKLVSGLESAKAGTVAGLDHTRDMSITSVDAALKGSLKSLDKQKHEQKQAVNDAGYVQQVAIEEQAHQVAAGLANGVNSAMESLEQMLGDIREKLLEGEGPAPEELSQVLTSAEEGLGGGVGTLLDKMQEGASTGETSMSMAGSNAEGALHEVTTGNATLASKSESDFASQMSSLTGGATDAMNGQADKQVAKAKDTAIKGSESMKLVATKFEGATEQIYTAVDGAITASLAGLNKNLKVAADGLEGKIASEAWRAASKEQAAWKGVVAIVLIILVIIASIALTIVTAGAGGVLGGILIGALIGAVTAGLIQVINNLASGEEWDKGLVEAVVMGAVGGALGGAIGAGANGLAQAALQGAVKAGASTLTRAAINVSINLAGDMIAEGATQAFGAAAFGQKMNWQGFFSAGLMSFASTARGGVAGAPTPKANGAVPAPAAGTRLGVGTDAAVGLGVATTVELANIAAGGEFDAKRFATGAAGAAGSSRGASLGANKSRIASAAPEVSTPSTTPKVTADVDVPATTPKVNADVDAPTTTPKVTPEVDAPTTIAKTTPEVDAPSTTPKITPEVEPPSTRKPTDTDTDSPATTRKPTDADTDSPTTTRKPGESEPDGSGQKRSGDDVDGALPTQKPKPEVGSTQPINKMSDADVTEMTKTPVKVGDADHETFVSKPSEKKVECGICSRACGPVKTKINDIENVVANKQNATDADVELVGGLQGVKQKVQEIESRIEGKMREGVYEAGDKVITLARDIAVDFQALGKKHSILGDAINDPTIIKNNSDNFALSGKAGAVDVDALILSNKLDTGSSKVFALDDFGTIKATMKLKDGQQCVYVLKGPDGAILKVGKSSDGNVGQRFGKYKKAGIETGQKLVLEVIPLKMEVDGQKLTQTDASGIETALRKGLEGEGHIMPWDNTRDMGPNHPSRLERPGTGVPFEPIRGKAYKNDEGKWRVSNEPTHKWVKGGNVEPVDPNYVPPVKQTKPEPSVLEQLYKDHNGDVTKVKEAIAKDHNMDRSLSNIYKWLRDAGVTSK